MSDVDNRVIDTYLGRIGKYQIVQTTLLILSVIPCAIHTMTVVFIGKFVDYRCATIDESVLLLEDIDLNETNFNNATLQYESCAIKVLQGSRVTHELKCLNGFEYQEPATHSFVSEWDLVCDSTSLSDLTQTVLSFGMMAGAFLFTVASDRFGRRPAHLVAGTGLLTAGIVSSFSPSLLFFTIVRFFIGVFQQGYGLTSGILMMEQLPTNKRHLMTVLGAVLWAIGLLIMSGLAYLAKDISWRHLERMLTGSSVILLFEFCFLDESIRWLLANNKLSQAEKLLKKVAKQNTIKTMAMIPTSQEKERLTPLTPDDSATNGIDELDSSRGGRIINIESEKQPAQKHTSLLDFVTNKRILLNICGSCFMWFTDSMVYYGLFLTSGNLANDLYLGFFLNCVAEIPTALILWATLNRSGRKRTISVGHVVAGLSLLVSTVLSTAQFAESVPGRTVLITCFGMLGKVAISLSFAGLFQYSPELFPTNLRNAGLGISSMGGRVALMIAPHSRTFAQYLPWGPGAIFVALCLTVPFILHFLPETKGQELPQTISDIDAWMDDEKAQNVTQAPENENRII